MTGQTVSFRVEAEVTNFSVRKVRDSLGLFL